MILPAIMYAKIVMISVVTILCLEDVTSSFGYLGTGPYKKATKPRFPNKRCANGFFGIWCNKQCVLNNHCKSCQHCAAVRCHHGTCVHTCKENWWGTGCNKACLQDYHCMSCQHCVSNECKNGACMHKCEANWWGPHCNKMCSKGCLLGSCTDGDGKCNQGCRVKYFGSHCTEECSVNCLSGRCSASGGACTDGCNDGYFASRCNLRCSMVAKNCKVCFQHKSRCTRCHDGWYGPDCQQRCGEGCVDNKCDITGSCNCREGYFGNGCHELSSPFSKFWRNARWKAVSNYSLTNTGCMIEGKLRERNTVFSLAGSGPCIKYKCQRKGVALYRKQSGCSGGDTCVSGKVTTGGAVFHCKVTGRTNRKLREVSVQRKLTITEKVMTNYNLTKNGCLVDGQLRHFKTVFTLPSTGSCVKYGCERRRLYIAKSKSGCSDGATCQKRKFTSGCSTTSCNIRQRQNRKSKILTLTRKITVHDRDTC